MMKSVLDDECDMSQWPRNEMGCQSAAGREMQARTGEWCVRFFVGRMGSLVDKKERRRSVDRLQRHKVWVDKLQVSADGGAGVAQISPGPDPGEEEHKSQKMSMRMRSF